MTDYTNRRVKMFRTNIEPGIPPKPRKAFSMDPGPHQFQGEVTRTKDGVAVKVKFEAGIREFEVFSTNIECIEYYPEELKVVKKAKE